MKTYKVTAMSVTLHRGLLRLTPEQAARRTHALKLVANMPGVYELIGPTCFKRGEVFGHDSDANKALLQEMEEAPGAKLGTHRPKAETAAGAVKDKLIGKLTGRKAAAPTPEPTEPAA